VQYLKLRSKIGRMCQAVVIKEAEPGAILLEALSIAKEQNLSIVLRVAGIEVIADPTMSSKELMDSYYLKHIVDNEPKLPTRKVPVVKPRELPLINKPQPPNPFTSKKVQQAVNKLHEQCLLACDNEATIDEWISKTYHARLHNKLPIDGLFIASLLEALGYEETHHSELEIPDDGNIANMLTRYVVGQTIAKLRSKQQETQTCNNTSSFLTKLLLKDTTTETVPE